MIKYIHLLKILFLPKKNIGEINILYFHNIKYFFIVKGDFYNISAMGENSL